MELISSDGESFPAARLLLMHASPFFYSMLSGPFKEARARRVDVAIPTRLLRDILHFVYLEESPLVAAAHLLACETAPIPSRARLCDAIDRLVEFAAAADSAGLERLVRPAGHGAVLGMRFLQCGVQCDDKSAIVWQ